MIKDDMAIVLLHGHGHAWCNAVQHPSGVHRGTQGALERPEAQIIADISKHTLLFVYVVIVNPASKSSKILCDEIFGPCNGLLSLFFWVQPPTQKVIGRLGACPLSNDI